MSRALAAASLAAACLLSACETPDPDLGHALYYNRNIQVVDMNPAYAGTPMEGSDGVRLVDAQNRYLQGKVKDLLKVDGKSGIGQQGGAADATTGGTGRSAAPGN